MRRAARGGSDGGHGNGCPCRAAAAPPRFTRLAADTMRYEFTVDDPTVWTAP